MPATGSVHQVGLKPKQKVCGYSHDVGAAMASAGMLCQADVVLSFYRVHSWVQLTDFFFPSGSVNSTPSTVDPANRDEASRPVPS